jgi:hypothetical protein
VIDGDSAVHQISPETVIDKCVRKKVKTKTFKKLLQLVLNHSTGKMGLSITFFEFL